jgi:hypothetical protein
MFYFKVVISLVTIVLLFVGYLPYIKDVLNKKISPHAFTWFVWTLAGGIAYALQVVGGAGVGSWALLGAVIICFVIFILSLRVGNKDITISDIFFLILALVSLYLWLVVDEPRLAVIFATSAEILGIVPTIRKSWNKPYSENLWAYEIAVLRHGLSILALQQFNLLTVLYPASWTIVCLLFTGLLLMRRRAIPLVV